MSQSLPVHFLTIVLNGAPFLEAQATRLRRLDWPWHWHVVEGVAALRHDTAWSTHTGGRVPDEMHRGGLSVDGTAEFLDGLHREEPTRVTVYRPPAGRLWDGKREMVGAPLTEIREEVLLWQLDVDEFWAPSAIERMCRAFEDNPSRTAAWYWCNFYTGPESVISTRNCYGQTPSQEWLRTWRFRPGDSWEAHEPPTLVRTGTGDVGKLHPFDQNETERLGAVFDHLAYVRSEQLAFKEIYYGYAGALNGWERLQIAAASGVPARLGEFFPWVTDTTYVEKADLPAARILEGARGTHAAEEGKPPMVLIDAIAFQDPWNPGICRVWESVLRCWVETGFSRYVTVLDRGTTFPEIPGINRLPFPRCDDSARGYDTTLIQQACDQCRAEVFVSTNYTSPITTPSVCMVYDFIPERLGCDMEGVFWREKEYAIRHASAFVCISRSTADDLLALHPGARGRTVRHAHLGIGEAMRPRSEAEIAVFRSRHGIGRPYFLLVGERIGLCGEVRGGRGYKNASLFFRALSESGLAPSCDVVVVGGAREFEAELAVLAPEVRPIMVRAADDELAAAYSGALCLVYPSKYEGFGLPVAEALACACPVITCRNSSLAEIAGEDVIYVDPDDEAALAVILRRAAEVGLGRMSADVARTIRGRFQWSNMAEVLQEALAAVAVQGPDVGSLWREFRMLQYREEFPQPQEFRHLIGLIPGVHWLARITRPARKALSGRP